MASNNALEIASTVDYLISSFRAHMLSRSLPAPAYVRLDALCREVSVFPHSGRDLVSKLGNLLLWAHTLTDVSAEWWRSNDGLYVIVHGRTESGLRMEVHQGGTFSQTAGLVHLEPDQTEGVSLEQLHALVTQLREAHPEEGA